MSDQGVPPEASLDEPNGDGGAAAAADATAAVVPVLLREQLVGMSRIDLMEHILRLQTKMQADQDAATHERQRLESELISAKARSIQYQQQVVELTAQLAGVNEELASIRSNTIKARSTLSVRTPSRNASHESLIAITPPADSAIEPPMTPRSSFQMDVNFEKRMSRSIRWAEQMRVTRKLYIKISEAKDLPKANSMLPAFMADKWESLNHYVVVSLDDREFARTKAVAKQLMWNEEFERELDGPLDALVVTLWSQGKFKAMFKDTALGQVIVKYDQLSKDQQKHEDWVPMFRPRKNKDTSLLGSLCADISLTSNNIKSANGVVLVTIRIIEAHNLGDKEDIGLCYPYVALHILPDDELRSTQQTQPRPDTVDPVYNETFTFTVPKLEINDAKLHLSVWNSHGPKKDSSEHDFMGQVTLPLCEFEIMPTPVETLHWYTLSDRMDVASKGVLTSAANSAVKAAKIISRGSGNFSTSADKSSVRLSRTQSSLASLIRSNSSLDMLALSTARHDLVATTFSTPTDCEQCGGSVIRPAYKCKQCGLCVHDACRAILLSPCATAGTMRLTLRFSEEVMLPYGSYTPLLELLTDANLLVLTALGQVCEVERLTEVARCSLNIFQSQGTAVKYLTQLITSEVNSTKDVNTIFRSNTLATKAVDHYMKLVGRDYLVHVLKKVIHDIYTEKKNCELDPSRISEKEKRNSQAMDFSANRKNLTVYLRRILDSIFSSADQCPSVLRQIFEHMQKEVEAKFPNEPSIRYIVISGFVFLRFFCPAILGPKLFGLRHDFPDAGAARTLTLSAKVLQNLANLADFGQKEPYMLEMNELLTEKKEAMMGFIDILANNRKQTSVRIQQLEERVNLEIKIFEGVEAMKTAGKDGSRNSRSMLKRELTETQMKIMELSKELDNLKKARDAWESTQEPTDFSKKFTADIEVELARMHGHITGKRAEIVAALEAIGDEGTTAAVTLQLVLEDLSAMRARLQKQQSPSLTNLSSMA